MMGQKPSLSLTEEQRKEMQGERAILVELVRITNDDLKIIKLNISAQEKVIKDLQVRLTVDYIGDSFMKEIKCAQKAMEMHMDQMIRGVKNLEDIKNALHHIDGLLCA